jgi:transposase InsO family protein
MMGKQTPLTTPPFRASSTNPWLSCKATSRSSGDQSSGRFACPESELRAAVALPLIHFLKVSAFMFNSSATDPTVRLPRLRTFASACSLNSAEYVCFVFNLPPLISSIRKFRGDNYCDAGGCATDEGWLYVAGIKDVFTCELVGYAMGERMTQGLTAQALWRAVRNKRPEKGLIHHSNRGSQYCAHDYRKLVEQFGMQASMSRKGNCFDNAPMESFWGSLKNELIHHHRYATRADAKAAIQEYIESFYNRQRRHSRLGYVPPALFAEAFSKQQQAA